MTSISKNVFIGKLDDAVYKYNNTYHSTIKMEPVDVKLITHINSSKEINDEDPKFKIGDIVRISKFKKIFAKAYIENWLEEVFVITKVKDTVPWTYVISNLKGEEFVGTSYKKNCKKQIEKSLGLKNVKNRKGDKLYIKWKDYDNSFISWIDKKRHSINN